MTKRMKTKIMKNRAETAALINHQLANETKTFKGCWHYGIQELRDLMDFIYDGEPTDDKEEIK